MNAKYDQVRSLIFSPSREANLYLYHVVFLMLLVAYPIAVEDLNLPVFAFTVMMVVYILFTLLLPEKLNYGILAVGIVAVIYVLLNSENLYDEPSFLVKSALLFLFTFLTFINMMREILKSDISLRLIFLCIDGYLFLGMCFSFLFRIMHYLDSNAFNFPINQEFNHIYMSFVVFTSTGLGDLLPTAMASKALVMLNGLCGQIYLAFFAAMIVGKYLSKTINS